MSAGQGGRKDGSWVDQWSRGPAPVGARRPPHMRKRSTQMPKRVRGARQPLCCTGL